jgi:hypothetical protein
MLAPYERRLAPRCDSRDEHGDVAQRAFERLSVGHIDVMLEPVSALQECFDRNVGEFMDYLQDYQRWLISLLHGLHN